MRTLVVLVGSLVVLMLMNGCGQKQQEVVKDIIAHSDHASMILENDYVKVMLFELKPNAGLPLHQGEPRLVYALSDYTIDWTEAGNTTEKSWQSGDAHWHEAGAHAIKNTGTSDARFLVVSRTSTPLPEVGADALSQDASAVDTMHADVVYENDHVRLMKVSLPAGESQPMHQGANRLLYALSSYEIAYASDQTDTVRTSFEAGEAHWHGADEHAVENVGTTPAEFLVFAFKQ